MGGPTCDDASSTTVRRNRQPTPPAITEAAASTPSTHTSRIRGRSSIIDVEWGAATHVGNVRTVNEDALCVASPTFLVADGMGGHDGGEVASSLVAGALASFPSGKAASRVSILASIAAANELVFDHSGRGEKIMGTTLTGIAFTDEPSPSLVILNVGDSRTYLVEGPSITQVTKDHSYVQELVDAGEIDEEQAAHHAERNVVTRALGIEAHVDVDATTVAARPGQRWMMCSDGLSGEVDLPDIERILAAGSPQGAVDGLIAAVLAGRGADNVSVVVVDVVAVEELDDPDRTDPRPSQTVPTPPPTPLIEAAPTFPTRADEDHP